MTLGGSLLGAGLDLLFAILEIIKWLVIVAAVVSWVSPDPRNPIVQFLYRSTEPILRPFRRILPPGRTGGIDFSPILVILLIFFLKNFLSRLLLMPARAL
ncbi:MAG TPA: YggT family protein [Thermoanaerobaculia bacterium]|nr:YggT family protein [Thermoanaerobaculia bacterium]